MLNVCFLSQSENSHKDFFPVDLRRIAQAMYLEITFI